MSVINFNPNRVKQSDKIQIHQNIRMAQDVNPSSCSSLVTFIYWACARQEVYLLQQGWTRLVEMTESERDN